MSRWKTPLVLSLAAALFLGACTAQPVSTTATPETPSTAMVRDATSVDEDEATPVETQILRANLATIPESTLTQEEIDGLVWMREEEKLARDVYLAMYDLWGLRVFSNIASSEQTHMDAVLQLLDRYDIVDPAANTSPGEFMNPDLQLLYDDLIAQGNQSLEAALTVGATIEDLDIADLQQRATDTPDIALVYANLEKGSRNHMRAFVRNLDQRGVAYSPVYISQADFDAIVSSSMQQGAGS
jgi:hypothetical protein